MADPVSWGFIASGLATAGPTGMLFSSAAAASAFSALSTAGAVLGTLSAGLGVVSAISGHMAGQEATEYNSRMAAEQSAQIAIERDQQLEQQKRAYRLTSGANIARAAAGEGGISGSTFDLLADNASQNALDLLTINQNAAYSQQKIKVDDGLSRKKTSPTLLGTGTKVLTSLAPLYGKV